MGYCCTFTICLMNIHYALPIVAPSLLVESTFVMTYSYIYIEFSSFSIGLFHNMTQYQYNLLVNNHMYIQCIIPCMLHVTTIIVTNTTYMYIHYANTTTTVNTI